MFPISEQYLHSPCEVKSMDNSPILTGSISGITDDGIQISDGQDTLPIIHCNTTVKVNIFNNSLGFKVLIGEVYLSTREFTRIVGVQNAADYEKRNFFRIKLSISTAAVALREEGRDGDETEPEDPFSVQIRDLSLNGLFLITDHSLNLFDRIAVDLNVSGTKLTLLCKVVRTVPVEMGTADGYGCEFIGNTGRQFDLLCKYLYDCQREQIRLMKETNS